MKNFQEKRIFKEEYSNPNILNALYSFWHQKFFLSKNTLKAIRMVSTWNFYAVESMVI